MGTQHNGVVEQLYNGEGEITITESTLTENTAHHNGGAIYNLSEIKITESTLKENEPDDVCEKGSHT